jgi:hypothetical protein
MPSLCKPDGKSRQIAPSSNLTFDWQDSMSNSISPSNSSPGQCQTAKKQIARKTPTNCNAKNSK